MTATSTIRRRVVSCADPESFVRGGPTLTRFCFVFFKFDGGGIIQIQRLAGPHLPASKSHLNGVLLACPLWPNIDCWLGSFTILRGSGPGPQVIKHVSCSTQLSLKFQLLVKTKMLKNTDFKLSDGVFILLINVKMQTIVGILTFISKINFMLS